MENKNRVLAGVALLVLVVSAIAIARQIWPSGYRYLPAFDECVGAKVAEATAKLLLDQGDIVLVSWAGSPVESAVTRAQMRGFQRALAQHSGLKVIGSLVPSKEEEGPAPGGIPKPLVERAMTEYPQAKALVSFLGVPILDGRFGALDPAKLPAVVALSLGEVEQWQALINSKIPAAVVRSRQLLQQQPTQPAQSCDDFIVVSNTGKGPAGAESPAR